MASERARFAPSTPKVTRGRPASTDQDARRWARQRTHRHQQLSDVCPPRLVFVTRRLSPSARHQWRHSTRGLPHVRKLRERMEHLYALLDRRGRTQTALAKRRKLRQWVNRVTWRGHTFKKVFSSHLEHALTVLDDTLVPATSQAVARGKRRHRKRQKRGDRVRRKVCFEGRMALDMLRESRAEGRDQTTEALHQARRGYT